MHVVVIVGNMPPNCQGEIKTGQIHKPCIYDDCSTRRTVKIDDNQLYSRVRFSTLGVRQFAARIVSVFMVGAFNSQKLEVLKTNQRSSSMCIYHMFCNDYD